MSPGSKGLCAGFLAFNLNLPITTAYLLIMFFLFVFFCSLANNMSMNFIFFNQNLDFSLTLPS